MTPQEKLKKIEEKYNTGTHWTSWDVGWLINRVNQLEKSISKITSCCSVCTICASCELSKVLKGEE